MALADSVPGVSGGTVAFLCDCAGTDHTGNTEGGDEYRKFSDTCMSGRCGIGGWNAIDKRKK